MRRVFKAEYSENPKRCEVCGKILDWKHRRNKFCDHVCAAKSYVGRVTKRAHKCPYCEKNVRYNRKWCSHKCQILYEFEYKRKNHLAIGKNSIRTYLMLTRERECAKCKLSEWFGKPIILEAHHNDGNHNNNEDNNLELLCPNCHALTENYKAKNKGNGRDNRRLKREHP